MIVAKWYTKQDGQILLITLLILSVAMTITLGLVSRGTTDTNITNQLEESNRAFNAAEAGIEEALLKGKAVDGTVVTLSGDVKYTTTVVDVGGAYAPYKFPNITKRGMTETVWFVNHNADGTLNETPTYLNDGIDVCWTTANVPAMTVSILYKAKSDSTYKMVRGSYDYNAATNGNEFDASGITSGDFCGQTGVYKRGINFSEYGIDAQGDTLLVMRLRPLYADAWISVNPSTWGYAAGLGNSSLPTQAYRHDVTGQTGSKMTRRIIANQYFAAPVSLFDFAVFSQGGFTR